MKKALVVSILSLITFSFSLFAQSAPSVSSIDSIENSIKTNIIEKDSMVYIKSVQVTTTQITSQRIAQEIQKLNEQRQKLNEQKKQIDEQDAQIFAQLKEFERLLGGVIVTEEAMKKKKNVAVKTEKEGKKETKKE